MRKYKYNNCWLTKHLRKKIMYIKYLKYIYIYMNKDSNNWSSFHKQIPTENWNCWNERWYYPGMNIDNEPKWVQDWLLNHNYGEDKRAIKYYVHPAKKGSIAWSSKLAATANYCEGHKGTSFEVNKPSNIPPHLRGGGITKCKGKKRRKQTKNRKRVYKKKKTRRRKR